MLSKSTVAEEAQLHAAIMAAIGWIPGEVNTLTTSMVHVNGLIHSDGPFTVVVDDDLDNPTVQVIRENGSTLIEGELMDFSYSRFICSMQVWRH